MCIHIHTSAPLAAQGIAGLVASDHDTADHYSFLDVRVGVSTMPTSRKTAYA
jgi:hypothetical protein